MAVDHNHWPASPTSISGPRLINSLNGFEQSLARLVAEMNTMNADLTGNGTDDTHYTNVTTRYGFGSNEIAHAARNELLAAVAKVNSLGDAGNTVGVAAEAALAQMFTRLRA